MAADTSNGSKHIFTQKYSGKQIFIIVSIIIFVLLLDTSVIRLSDLTLKSTSNWTLTLFAFISAISLAGQNLILRFIKHNIEESTHAQKNLRLNSIYKVALTVHYVLAAILVFVILQMLTTSRYDVVLLTTAMTISYIFAIAMMGILSHRFFSWFRLNKSYVIFLYGLSSGMLLVNACVTLLLVNSILLARPPEVIPHAILQVTKINDYPTLNYAHTITTIISFIITWFATMALLRNYTKMRRFTYQFALILPLTYFVSQFLVFSLGLLGPTLILNPIFYGILFTLIFTLSKPIGGIIFGIGFWMIARNINKDNVVRSYLIISGYGFLLFFTSNQAIVLAFTYYPPFGLVTISFVGLSSYLVLAGIYSSALSISQDANLRRQIRRLAIRESKLLDSIGSAQMEEEVRRRVLHVVRLNKTDTLEAGIPSALDEEHMHSYLDAVLEEIKASKKERSAKNENP
jgi:hypothetical protein